MYAGLGIYDIMNLVTCPVYTYCVGLAASMGALLLQAGEKGHRHSLPNSRIMIHQPLGGARGQASDVHIQAQEIQDLKNTLNGIMAKHTGQSIELIEKSTDRDNYLNPTQAKEFGLIDAVIEKKAAKL